MIFNFNHGGIATLMFAAFHRVTPYLTSTMVGLQPLHIDSKQLVESLYVYLSSPTVKNYPLIMCVPECVVPTNFYDT